MPALIVLLSYALIIVFYNKQQLSLNNIIHFVFLEFFKGGIRTGSGLDNLLFTAINFIRTFFQAHGLMLILFKKTLRPKSKSWFPGTNTSYFKLFMKDIANSPFASEASIVP